MQDEFLHDLPSNTWGLLGHYQYTVETVLLALAPCKDGSKKFFMVLLRSLANFFIYTGRIEELTVSALSYLERNLSSCFPQGFRF
jgi:hypothetical protein